MSKDTKKQTAETLFASTAHDVLWANPKGEFFTSENIGKLSLNVGQKLTKFERTEETLKEKVRTLNQGETIAAILKVESLEALKEFEADERIGVKSAYEDQKAKLTDAIEVTAAAIEAGATTNNGNKDTEDKK